MSGHFPECPVGVMRGKCVCGYIMACEMRMEAHWREIARIDSVKARADGYEQGTAQGFTEALDKARDAMIRLLAPNSSHEEVQRQTTVEDVLAAIDALRGGD